MPRDSGRLAVREGAAVFEGALIAVEIMAAQPCLEFRVVDAVAQTRLGLNLRKVTIVTSSEVEIAVRALERSNRRIWARRKHFF
jgi:hypothetical protein